MKKAILRTCLLAGIIVLSACGTTAKFVYPDNMRDLVRVSDSPIYNNVNVAVIPFDDNTNNENDSSCIILGYIPLIPYGWCYYSRPETAVRFASETLNGFSCNSSEDLAKAFAMSLRQSNLFEDAYFSFGGDKDKANFVVTGRINEFSYKGQFITYGLSSYGAVFWLLGAPCGTSYNAADVTLYLRKNGSNKILWEYNVKGNSGYYQWIYYNYGYDVKNYSKIIQSGYNDAILDLQKKMRDNPEMFK